MDLSTSRFPLTEPPVVTDRDLKEGNAYIFRGWWIGPGPLRLWERPSTYSREIGRLEDGDIVTVLEVRWEVWDMGAHIDSLHLLTHLGPAWHVLNHQLGDKPVFNDL